MYIYIYMYVYVCMCLHIIDILILHHMILVSFPLASR